MNPKIENPEQLILGIAHGLDVPTLEPFVFSLGRSGYRGRTRIFVARKDRKVREFLVSRGIEVQDFDAARDSMLAGKRFLRMPHQAMRLLEFLALRALQPLAARDWGRDLYARLAPLDITALRYLLYRLFLAGPAAAGVRQVFLLDIRDVFFQRDPFDFKAPEEGLACFLEESDVTIGRCGVNSIWVRTCYGPSGLAAIADRGILCSGATLGERGAIERYLDAMIREIATVAGRRFVPHQGLDQACHNHIFYRSPPAPFIAFENGAGPVIHLDHRPAGRLAFSPEGMLLGDDGQVIHVIHQWDRRAAAFQATIDRIRRAG